MPSNYHFRCLIYTSAAMITSDKEINTEMLFHQLYSIKLYMTHATSRWQRQKIKYHV